MFDYHYQSPIKHDEWDYKYGVTVSGYGPDPSQTPGLFGEHPSHSFTWVGSITPLIIQAMQKVFMQVAGQSIQRQVGIAGYMRCILDLEVKVTQKTVLMHRTISWILFSIIVMKAKIPGITKYAPILHFPTPHIRPSSPPAVLQHS